MKIVVLGYYGKHNLGDDLFKTAITRIVHNFDYDANILFLNPEDVSRIPDTDIVLVGGGDLINDYFMNSLRNLLRDKRCPVYGVGIGFPYPNLITPEYLDIFDVMITRTANSFPLLEKTMPGRAFLAPDLVRTIPFFPMKRRKEKTIGVFFANSICPPNSPLVQKLATILESIASETEGCAFSYKYKIILCSMNTSGSNQEDDNVLNRAVMKLVTSKNIELCEKAIDPKIVNALFSSFYATICTRYHAHILSLCTETPFISLYSTEKVHDLLESENLLKYGHKMETDEKLRPVNIDTSIVLKNFHELERERDVYKKLLKEKSSRNKREVLTLQNGLFNLFYHKPKYGCKLLKRTLYKIHKYLSHDRPELQMDDLYTPGYFSREDADFVAEVVTFCIARKEMCDFTWGLREQIGNDDFVLVEAVKWILDNVDGSFNNWDDCVPSSLKKFNFEYFNPSLMKGYHRAGWQYVVENLSQYHNPKGIVFDVYADKTFGWKREFFKKCGILPFKRRWAGVFHHTQNTEYSCNNLKNVVECPEFIQSLDKCVGIIVLSDYLARFLLSKFPYLNVHVIHHPTIFVKNTFDLKKYKLNLDKKVVQIGAWYRDSYAIYALPQPTNHRKFALKGRGMENYFPPPDFLEKLKECLLNNEGCDGPCRQKSNKFAIGLVDHVEKSCKSVTVLENLDNNEYDNLLSENIVFINLVDASACNTIIECMVRNTPILVNRLPAVVEYLGPGYPLYYETFEEAVCKLNDYHSIKSAYLYLKNRDKSDLSIYTFLSKFETFSKLI